jgi:hypothetical protein
MRKAMGKDGGARSISKQIFRYWVEVCELRTGAVRRLPLKTIAKIHIPRKKAEAHKPTEEVLQLEDGTDKLEAKNLDDLAVQLRQRYPDGEYERRLQQERDHEAERRWADGMNGLIRILAEAAVDELLREKEA